MLLLLLALLTPAAAHARSDEDEIRRAVRDFSKTPGGHAGGVSCPPRVEGDWAACHFSARGKGVEEGGCLVLHKTRRHWKVVRTMTGRGGPVDRTQWTLDCKAHPLSGCTGASLPPSVVALFGYGPVPPAAFPALRTQARRLNSKAGQYCIATYGRKLFARTTWSSSVGPAPGVVWEYVNGSWSQVFREASTTNYQHLEKQYTSHGFSLWMMWVLCGNVGAASGIL
jgi:hypothetical protein